MPQAIISKRSRPSTSNPEEVPAAWIGTVVVYRRTELRNVGLRAHTERLQQELFYILTTVRLLQVVSAGLKKTRCLTTTDND
jgi:hypothetical protein